MSFFSSLFCPEWPQLHAVNQGGNGRVRPKILTSALLVTTVMAAGGCFEAEIPAPSATVSPIASYMRPAKSPNCSMPVLHTMPASEIQQLALVDTWGDQSASDADLLVVLKRKGCELGADAVVVTSDKTQHQGDQLAGYDDKVGSDVVNRSANVTQRMHDPTVGEVGHGGHYLSGVAIAFTRKNEDTSSNAAP